MGSEDCPDEIDFSDGIWAAGNGRTNRVHFYASKKDYENGTCLCGRTIRPRVPFTKWDPSIEFAKENTCPQCLKRIGWLKFR